MFYNMCTSMNTLVNMARPYPVGVASGLATVIYVAMVKPISYSPNDSNLKHASYWLYG